jgi:hypothetical protein
MVGCFEKTSSIRIIRSRSVSWRAINTVGLDSHVGFLHEMDPSKESLDYDMQKLYKIQHEVGRMLKWLCRNPPA